MSSSHFRPAVIIWHPYRQKWLAEALWRMRFDFKGWNWSDVTKYMNYQSKQKRERPIFVESKVKSYVAANEAALKKLDPGIEETEKFCAVDGSYREPKGGTQASHVLREKQQQERQLQEKQQQYQQQQEQHQRRQQKEQIRQQLKIQTVQRQAGQAQQIQQMQQMGRVIQGEGRQAPSRPAATQFNQQMGQIIQGERRQPVSNPTMMQFNPYPASYAVADEQKSRSNH